MKNIALYVVLVALGIMIGRETHRYENHKRYEMHLSIDKPYMLLPMSRPKSGTISESDFLGPTYPDRPGTSIYDA